MGINKDQIKGRAKAAKGALKEATGGLVGNESLRARGNVQKHVGLAQATSGDIKADARDAVKRKGSR
jgi:uncharacterized protein YjbJ (UPF0337 family)